jgi:hypothetical protein
MIIALAAALAAATVDGERIGNWTVAIEKDAMTDKVDVSAHVITEAARIDFGCPVRRRVPFSVTVNTKTYLGETIGGRGTFVDLELRGDDRPAEKIQVRADGTGFAATFGDEVAKFRTSMTGANRLRGRVYSYRGQPANFDFDITGFDEMRARIVETCTPA